MKAALRLVTCLAGLGLTSPVDSRICVMLGVALTTREPSTFLGAARDGRSPPGISMVVSRAQVKDQLLWLRFVFVILEHRNQLRLQVL